MGNGLILGGVCLIGLLVWGIQYQYFWNKIQGQMVYITAKHGLVIDDIMIEGRFHADVEDVKNAIGVDRGDPIFLYSPAFIKQRLETLSWVRSALVQRILPNIIYVRLSERRPVAIWQNRGKHFLIEGEGKIIDSDKIGLFKDLPLVVGSGAPTGAGALLEELDKYPFIKKNMTAAIRVGERRWDLQFKNGLKLRLPETGIGLVLAEFIKLNDQHQVMKRDIKVIDMRFPDRLVLSLSQSLAAGVRSRTKGRAKKV
jgi:cell division protein FtsQ